MYNDFIAGVDLAGERLPDGMLRSYLNGVHIWQWPETVMVGPNTYTLERVTTGDDGYECAHYC
tara:strand:- start:451 stop:639 length:189 start_codon:yes stop_codon:yes gene_type:complete